MKKEATISAEKYIHEIQDVVESLGDVTNPRRDWSIVVVCGWIVLLLFIAFDAYLFIQISRGEIFLSSEYTPLEIQTIDRDKLHNLIETYELKGQSFETTKSSAPRIVDPSL